MTTTHKRRIGRKRWGALVRFLTDKMQNAASERVQMTAALRLADVLSLREQREQLEMRRELRDAGKATDASQGNGQPEGPPETQGRAQESVEEFLKRVRTTSVLEETERAKDEIDE